MSAEINWEEIYAGTIKQPQKAIFTGNQDLVINDKVPFQINKKFESLIKPIPWYSDFDKNIALTLEWLVRDHRKENLRLYRKFLHQHVRDLWFHNEYDPGTFVHVCFPNDLLNYRMQYDAIYAQQAELEAVQMSKSAIYLIDTGIQRLWSQWKCIGKDGISKINGDIKYKYSCSRCCSEMPKGVKMFIMLTQSKLKDI